MTGVTVIPMHFREIADGASNHDRMIFWSPSLRLKELYCRSSRNGRPVHVTDPSGRTVNLSGTAEEHLSSQQ